MISNKRVFIYIAAAFSALGGLLFGYDTGVISGAILFIRSEFGLTTFQEEVVVSAVLLGAVIGTACAGYLSDKIGRRRLLLITALIFFLGSLGSAFAPTIILLTIARIFVGISIGISSMTTPLYIAEISPADIRGRLVSLNQFAITIGIVVSYVVDYAFSAHGAWRWMVGIGVFPAIVFGFGMLFLPESPRWLFKHKGARAAMGVLKSIHGKEIAQKEMAEIEGSIQKTKKKWSDCITPWFKRALLIGMCLAAFQQLTGINTVIYYAPTIFEFAGFKSPSIAILATGIVGMVNMLSTIIALWLLDRVGRRPLLLIGLVGMVISLGILGLSFHIPSLASSVGWLTVACLVLYVASFAMSLGPIFWLLIAEIYPLEIRGRAMSIATVVNWVANLLVALTFLTLIDVLGKPGAFWFYAAIGVGAWFFSYFLVPETKNKTLEEIEVHWNRLRHG